MHTNAFNRPYRLRLNLYFYTRHIDEGDVLAVHRMCKAVQPILAHHKLGSVNKISFRDDEIEIEFVVPEVDLALQAIAPAMGCFEFMESAFQGDFPASATYNMISSDEGSEEVIEFDLENYLPATCDTESRYSHEISADNSVTNGVAT